MAAGTVRENSDRGALLAILLPARSFHDVIPESVRTSTPPLCHAAPTVPTLFTNSSGAPSASASSGGAYAVEPMSYCPATTPVTTFGPESTGTTSIVSPASSRYPCDFATSSSPRSRVGTAPRTRVCRSPDAAAAVAPDGLAAWPEGEVGVAAVVDEQAASTAPAASPAIAVPNALNVMGTPFAMPSLSMIFI